jgi:hypothetical protein
MTFLQVLRVRLCVFCAKEISRILLINEYIGGFVFRQELGGSEESRLCV